MSIGHLTRIPCILLALWICQVNLPSGAPKRRFTVADDIELSHFGDPYSLQTAPITFSPDGRYFAVDTERGLLKQNRPESTLRVFSAEDVSEFLLHPNVTGGPVPFWVFSKSTYKDGPIITKIRWLPDASGLGFLLKTDSGNDQLFLADLRTKKIQALTLENQHVTAFDFHDRNHFVYTVQSPAIRERAIAEARATSIVGTGRDLYTLSFPENLYPLTSRWHDLSELWVVQGGKRYRVEDQSADGPLAIYLKGQRTLALSPDGRSLATVLPVNSVYADWESLYLPSVPSDPNRIRAGRQDLRAFDGQRYVSEYALIELGSGKVKPMTDAPIGESAGWWSGVLSADWSSDGTLVVLSNTFLSPNARGSQEQPNRPCIAVVDLVQKDSICLERLKGKAKTKTGFEDGFRSFQSVSFARGTRQIIAEYYGSDGSKGLTSYKRTSDGSWRSDGKADDNAAQGGGLNVTVKESLNEPPVLIATDKTTKLSHVILDPNPQLKYIDLGDASVFKWRDKTGRDWVGGLYKPPDYVQGQRYPLVVQTHGFYEFIFRPDGIFPTAFAARELAAAGMLVLQVQDCPYTVSPEEGPCNVAGYESAVQQLVADGMVDPNRVGIVGFSRTCYYILEELTTGTIHFNAASITDGTNYGYFQYISGVDIYNNVVSHEADAVIGTSPFGEGLQQWVKRSPEFRMENVTTPLQVVASGHPGLLGMWEPYATLRYLNKPVDLILLTEGTHVLTNPAARMVSQGGTVDWFRFWLKEEEDPTPAKAEQYARWRDLHKLQDENQKISAHSGLR